ncbi:unnamed protein product [Cylicocyclus nassatus]|uniref:Uncharacterized protein n=1 Tax=Cylicocyclus nassatus TaxID=53992 RepID=A0AA36H2V7_CYLNA|nr:unnamed protein product [Cylicocyclus nassatus]
MYTFKVSALSRTSSVYSSYQSQCSDTSSMNSFHHCLGCCRLRVASCFIGMISIAISVVTICCLLSSSSNLSMEVQSMISAPITGLVLFQIATSMLLIIGVLIDMHLLMMPFLLNSVVHICLAIGIATTVLLFSEDVKKLYVVCMLGLALYVYFTMVVAMTISLIRDKRRLGYDHQDDFDTRGGAFDRISSSVI